MWLSIKIIEQKEKTDRVTTFFPCPMTFPITMGEEEGNSIVVKGIPEVRMEYERNYHELFIIAAEPIYRIQKMAKNRIAANTKLILHNQDTLDIAGSTLEISLDRSKGDVLSKSLKAKAFLEEKFGKLWLIGCGGIASVYASENGPMAVKVLTRWGDPKVVQRFQEVSEKIQPLDHLGLIKMGKTYSYSDMSLYYTEMEYCRGVTLAEHIARKGAIKGERVVLSILQQLAEVVKYISSQEIVHRDIHPKNILVESGWSVKLMGFTMIKSVHSNLTQRGTLMFTPNFTAPEQIADPSQVDSKSDIFSLGAVAYCLFAGIPPFGASNHSTYIKMIQKKNNCVPLQDCNPNLPTPLYSIISRSLSFNRKDRPGIDEILDTYTMLVDKSPIPILNPYDAQTQRINTAEYWNRALDTREIRQIGRFKILRELGHGGLGRVYEALDTKVERKVAVKLLRRGIFADEEELRRFQEEARLVSRLRHPGVARIYEIGKEEGNSYIIMELIEGVRLDQWAKNATPREISEKIKEVAEILEYAHGENIIHRDIKPSNIMVHREDQRPILLDFGMAREITSEASITKTGQFTGTPAYASPEHFCKEAPSPTMDVYSLGIVFYELLTGQLPYKEEPLQLISMMLKGNLSPVSPGTLNPQIARDLETICLCSMNPDVRRRYPTAKALAEDIDRFLQGKIIEANPPDLFARTLHWSKRHWRYLLPGTVGLLILIIAFIYIPPLLNRHQRQKMLENLQKGKDILSAFPGENPRVIIRQSRLHLESARAFAPQNPEIKRALYQLYLKYGFWAVQQGQLEVAKDCLASLQLLADGDGSWRALQQKLDLAILIERQRSILIDWQQSPTLRIEAARFLMMDKSPATEKVFDIAVHDPEDKVRNVVMEILKDKDHIEGNTSTNHKSTMERATETAQTTSPQAAFENMLPPFQFPSIVLILLLLGDPDNQPGQEVIMTRYRTWLKKRGNFEKTIPDITEILHCPDGDMRRLALYFCSIYGREVRGVIPALIPLLADDNQSTAESCHHTLVKIGHYDSTTLVNALAHNNVSDKMRPVLIAIGEGALPAILDACQQPSPIVKSRALEILQKMKKDIIPFLIKNLRHPHPETQARVTELLKGFGKQALPQLVSVLHSHKSPAVYEEAIEILESMGTAAADATPTLLNLASSHGDPNVRYKSLEALMAIAPTDAMIPVLIQKLDDPYLRIVQFSLLNLRQFGKKSSPALGKLSDMLPKHEQSMQITIIDTLSAIEDNAISIRPVLEEMFARSSAPMAYAIAHAIARTNRITRTSLGNSYWHLQNSDAQTRADVLAKLGDSCKQKAILFFLAGLRDKDLDVNLRALKLLGKYPDTSMQVLEAVAGCLSHRAYELRKEAVEILGNFGTRAENTVPSVMKLFDDPIVQVRVAAAENIFKISPPTTPIFTTLLRSLSNNSEAVNSQIMAILLQAKPFPKDLVSALLPLLEEGNAVTTYHVITLLGQLGTDAVYAIPAMLTLFGDLKLQHHLENNLPKLGTPLPEQLPELGKCLQHASPLVRQKTLQVVATMKTKAAPLWCHIMFMFKGADPSMVKVLSETLNQIGNADPKHIEDLITAMKDANFYVRLYALKGIYKWKAQASPAIKTLIQILLYEPQRPIWEQAIEVLVEIGSPAIVPLLEALQREKSQRIAQRLAIPLAKMGQNSLAPVLKCFMETQREEAIPNLVLPIIQMGSQALDALLPYLETGNAKTKERALLALVSLVQNNKDPKFRQTFMEAIKKVHQKLSTTDPQIAQKIKKTFEVIGAWR